MFRTCWTSTCPTGISEFKHCHLHWVRSLACFSSHISHKSGGLQWISYCQTSASVLQMYSCSLNWCCCTAVLPTIWGRFPSFPLCKSPENSLEQPRIVIIFICYATLNRTQLFSLFNINVCIWENLSSCLMKFLYITVTICTTEKWSQP